MEFAGIDLNVRSPLPSGSPYLRVEFVAEVL
jgi:hypothetical protein